MKYHVHCGYKKCNCQISEIESPIHMNCKKSDVISPRKNEKTIVDGKNVIVDGKNV